MLDEVLSETPIGRCRDQDDVKTGLVRSHRWEMLGQLAAGIAHEINTPTQYIGDNLRFLRDAFADLRPLLSVWLALVEGRSGLTETSGETPDPLNASGETPDPLNASGETPDLLDTSGKMPDLVSGKRSTRKPAMGDEAKADVEFLLGEIPAAIEQSLEGVDRVAQMARSMRDFSHPDNGERHLVDFNRIVEDAPTISRNEWKFIAEATTDLDLGLPPVRCVPGEMHQVLLNLIVNAAHAVEARFGPHGDGRAFTAAKGTITVRTRQDGDWVQIEVEDTGAGIPEPIHDKVSSGSSQPRSRGGARARDWPSRGASSRIATGARFASTRKWAAAPCLRSAFRSIPIFRLGRATEMKKEILFVDDEPAVLDALRRILHCAARRVGADHADRRANGDRAARRALVRRRGGRRADAGRQRPGASDADPAVGADAGMSPWSC